MNKNRVYIIAEIGPNHNGSFRLAKKMINLLKHSDIDAIKFQIADPYKVYSKDAFKADYQKKNTLSGSILEMSKGYQLSKKEHLKLSKLCKKNKVDYMCSAFDLESLKFLVKKVKINTIKIPSGEIISLDILKYISSLKKKIILSTGMSTLNEIKSAIKVLNSNFKKKIILMHCVSSYPAEKKTLNLNLIKKLKNYFKCEVGYSDHSLGENACLAAVALGANVIEKHVTFSKKLKGPDHKASAEVSEFIKLVKKIREFETMMGTYKKEILKSELNTLKVARKSIVSKHSLKKGKIIKKDDIVFKRPGVGISPMMIKKVLGKKIKKNISEDKVIFLKDLKR